MSKACILIKAVPTAIDKNLEKIKQMSAVRKAYAIYGRWDIVVFIDAPTEEMAKVSSAINSLDGVRSSETLPEA